jgi:hypothetical protein
MRALLLVAVVACSSEKAVVGQTPEQAQELCDRSQKLAVTLVRERRSFAHGVQIVTERLDRVVRDHLREHPDATDLQPLQARATLLIDDATAARPLHEQCRKAFESGSEETPKLCADADAALALVWKTYRALADQVSKSKLDQADRDQIAEDATDKGRRIDNTFATLLAPLASCPRKPLSALH